jgi:hypothetical protein
MGLLLMRRKYIPKPDGRWRPLGIAALEDKLLQRAVVVRVFACRPCSTALMISVDLASTPALSGTRATSAVTLARHVAPRSPNRSDCPIILNPNDDLVPVLPAKVVRSPLGYGEAAKGNHRNSLTEPYPR